jgi:hypothetical protein
MSFLAPLYIAGFLAISLPIIFHLIRRSPQGRQQFSSLMFLPPRADAHATQQAHDILLLILRASALVLAGATRSRARFFRQE